MRHREITKSLTKPFDKQVGHENAYLSHVEIEANILSRIAFSLRNLSPKVTGNWKVLLRRS